MAGSLKPQPDKRFGSLARDQTSLDTAEPTMCSKARRMAGSIVNKKSRETAEGNKRRRCIILEKVQYRSNKNSARAWHIKLDGISEADGLVNNLLDMRHHKLRIE